MCTCAVGQKKLSGFLEDAPRPIVLFRGMYNRKLSLLCCPLSKVLIKRWNQLPPLVINALQNEAIHAHGSRCQLTQRVLLINKQWLVYTARHVASIPRASCLVYSHVRSNLKYTGTAQPHAMHQPSKCHTDGQPYNFCTQYLHRQYKMLSTAFSGNLHLLSTHPLTSAHARHTLPWLEK